jgi:phage baseplate assembly protein W
MRTYNINFPVADDSQNNKLFKMTTNKIDAVKSDVLLLLLTDKGSRVYNRKYGTNVRKYLFEPNDSITTFDIEEDIKMSIKKFLPNVTVKGIVTNNVGDRRVDLSITFTYNDRFGEFTDNVNLSFT